MAVVHIVLFKVAANTDPSAVSELINPVLALKKTCVRPQTGEPYIKSIRAGKNTVQGEQITHAIVFEFENLEDLTYYADTDPVHLATKANVVAKIGTVVDVMQTVNFTPDDI